MTTEESIFAAALAKAPGADRDAYLDAACAGDAGLRRDVGALLLAHERVDGILEAPLAGPAVTVVTVDDPAPGHGVGSTIGPYRLLERIGGGGMGVVYLAEQTRPVRRRVAVKVIRPGMDSGQVVARFEAERQALTMMDHPSIAKVLDAGTTDAGRPYFVMELVPGLPVTEYCDRNKLPPRQRLGLFVQICQAVQHAHTKGVIHRDLKPSNVLVTVRDDRAVPKVIDFGVAKAAGQQLTDKTLFTQFAQLVGTPLYMSPEQAQMGGVDVDTRSDVYSLGVLLYELLTGSTPFDGQRLGAAALDEVRRIIREEEPPRPSTRLSTAAAAAAAADAGRGQELRRLSGLVRGELDWIVMRCLEKDRGRRYGTAVGLAADVERYLADEPVHACPPSAAYRFRKFARRHRGPVLAGGLVLLALVGGIAGTTVGMTRAGRSAAAESAARQQAVAGEAQARKRLAQIERGNQVLTSIFADLDPNAAAEAGKPLRVVLGGRLALAADQLEGDAVGDPVVVAGLQVGLGDSMVGLGLAERAVPLLARAGATLTTHLGPDHADTLRGANSLANAHRAAGRPDLALPLYERTLERRQATLGPDHPHTLGSMGNLALAYRDAGRPDLAVPLHEQTLKLKAAALGPTHRSTLVGMNGLANAYQAAGRPDLAVPLYERTVELRRAALGPDHPDTLVSMGGLASAYVATGRADLAVPLCERTLKLQAAALGPDHPHTLMTMGNLASAHHAAGRLDLAVPLFEETVRRMRAGLGPDHPETLHNAGNLADAYRAAGEPEQAVPLFEETVKLQKARLGPAHPATLASMDGLAMAYRDADRPDEALALLEETVKLRRAKPAPERPAR